MNLQKLKDLIVTFERLKEVGVPDDKFDRLLAHFMYEEHKGSLRNLFLDIDDIEKEKVKEKEMLLYHGLEDAIHGLAGYSSKVNNAKELRSYDKFFSGDGSIPFMINIMKSYFPKGVSNGASENGKYLFNKFKDNLLKNKDQYLDGKSTQWAHDYGHYEYIKLVIEKKYSVR